VRIKRVSVIGALGTSAVFAAYDGYLFWTSRAPDEGLFSLHHFVLAFLLATWIVADTTAAFAATCVWTYVQIEADRTAENMTWFTFRLLAVSCCRKRLY
jgi:hypothetical protein